MIQDILAGAGIQAGLDTLLVHTGVTTRDMLIEKMVQPTYVLDSCTAYICARFISRLEIE